jgi:hypothetical protein
MTIYEYADYLGVGMRTVAKWESRGNDIEPLPQTQSILDTALTKASSDAQARFTAIVSDSLASKATAGDAAPDAGQRGGDVDAPTPSSLPAVSQSSVLPGRRQWSWIRRVTLTTLGWSLRAGKSPAFLVARGLARSGRSRTKNRGCRILSRKVARARSSW